MCVVRHSELSVAGSKVAMPDLPAIQAQQSCADRKHDARPDLCLRAAEEFLNLRTHEELCLTCTGCKWHTSWHVHECEIRLHFSSKPEWTNDLHGVVLPRTCASSAVSEPG